MLLLKIRSAMSLLKSICLIFANFKNLLEFLIACGALALEHATLNVVGVRGLLRGKGASLLRKLATASRP